MRSIGMVYITCPDGGAGQVYCVDPWKLWRIYRALWLLVLLCHKVGKLFGYLIGKKYS